MIRGVFFFKGPPGQYTTTDSNHPILTPSRFRHPPRIALFRARGSRPPNDKLRGKRSCRILVLKLEHPRAVPRTQLSQVFLAFEIVPNLWQTADI